MPEWGALPIPKKLLEAGIRDMVRISDARMSGTHGGTCVLHVAPESHVGGPLAFVRTGDIVSLDVAARSLTLHVSDEELAERRQAWTPPPPAYERGYGSMFLQHIQQPMMAATLIFWRNTPTTRTSNLLGNSDAQSVQTNPA